MTTEYQLWMIDHTRAFQFKHELLDDRVTRVRRGIWERLLAVTEEELREVVSGYLTPLEVRGVLQRRALLIEHLKKLITERGEKVVLY